MEYLLHKARDIFAVIGAISTGIAFIFLLAFLKWKARELGDILLCHWLTRHSRRERKARQKVMQQVDRYQPRINDLGLSERDYLCAPDDVRPANRIFRVRPSLPSATDDDPSSQRN